MVGRVPLSVECRRTCREGQSPTARATPSRGAAGGADGAGLARNAQGPPRAAAAPPWCRAPLALRRRRVCGRGGRPSHFTARAFPPSDAMRSTPISTLLSEGTPSVAMWSALRPSRALYTICTTCLMCAACGGAARAAGARAAIALRTAARPPRSRALPRTGECACTRIRVVRVSEAW